MREGDAEHSRWNTTLSGPRSPAHTGLVGARNSRTVITPIFAQSLLNYFQYNIMLRKYFKITRDKYCSGADSVPRCPGRSDLCSHSTNHQPPHLQTLTRPDTWGHVGSRGVLIKYSFSQLLNILDVCQGQQVVT